MGQNSLQLPGQKCLQLYLPIIYRLGGSYHLPQGEKNAFTFTLDLEQVQHQDDFIFHLGGEYSFSNLAALRLGLDDENFTAGLGVSYDQYTVDYALVTHEELGNKHSGIKGQVLTFDIYGNLWSDNMRTSEVWGLDNYVTNYVNRYVKNYVNK